jgi:hypothetical protein
MEPGRDRPGVAGRVRRCDSSLNPNRSRRDGRRLSPGVGSIAPASCWPASRKDLWVQQSMIDAVMHPASHTDDPVALDCDIDAIAVRVQHGRRGHPPIDVPGAGSLRKVNINPLWPVPPGPNGVRRPTDQRYDPTTRDDDDSPTGFLSGHRASGEGAAGRSGGRGPASLRSTPSMRGGGRRFSGDRSRQRARVSHLPHAVNLYSGSQALLLLAPGRAWRGCLHGGTGR